MDRQHLDLSEPFDFGAFLNYSDEDDAEGAGNFDFDSQPTNNVEGGGFDWPSSTAANNDTGALGCTDDLAQQPQAVSSDCFMSNHAEYGIGLPEQAPSVAGQNALEMLALPNEDEYTYAPSPTVTAEATGVGALRNTLNPPIEMQYTKRQRDSVKPRMCAVAGCSCLDCIYSLCIPCIGPAVKYGMLRTGHTSLKVCDTAGCGEHQGTLRVAETEHLFGPQGCLNKNVRCRCAAQGCHFFCVRWSDLKRHHAVKHCKDPERFPCPEFMCKYGGDNGFKRLDKLKSHYKKVHEGKPKANKTLRPIEPATISPAAKEGHDGGI